MSARIASWGLLSLVVACGTSSTLPSPPTTGDPSGTSPESADCGIGGPADACCERDVCGGCEVAVLCDAGEPCTLADRLVAEPLDPSICLGGYIGESDTYHLQCTLDGARVDVLQNLTSYYTSESWTFDAGGALIRASFGSDVSEFCEESSASVVFGPDEVDLTDCCEVRDATVLDAECVYDVC